MKTLVLGAAAGLGRNVVEEAARAGHEVRAFLHRTRAGRLPPFVQIIDGDATRRDEVALAMEGVDAAIFCFNPYFARWLDDFPPYLAAAVAAARESGVRLVFPASIWVDGPGRAGRYDHAPAATRRGRLRCGIEQSLRDSGCRFSMLRLPEYYGPHVVSSTAQVFRAALRRRRTHWCGPLDVDVEFVFTPDAAQALLEVAGAPGVDGEVFQVPGIPTTPRQFIDTVYQAAEARPRPVGVAEFALNLVGLGAAAARSAVQVARLGSKPTLLDGSNYSSRFGRVPQTPYAEGIALTLAWHRAIPNRAGRGDERARPHERDGRNTAWKPIGRP